LYTAATRALAAYDEEAAQRVGAILGRSADDQLGARAAYDRNV